MWFGDCTGMHVPVVFVVDMQMLVNQFLMPVKMRVFFTGQDDHPTIISEAPASYFKPPLQAYCSRFAQAYQEAADQGKALAAGQRQMAKQAGGAARQ